MVRRCAVAETHETSLRQRHETRKGSRTWSVGLVGPPGIEGSCSPVTSASPVCASSAVAAVELAADVAAGLSGVWKRFSLNLVRNRYR